MKKFGRWKSFDFGCEQSATESKSSPNKIKDCESIPKENKNVDFYRKIMPKSLSDLAVHTKKVQEVEGWLKCVLNGNSFEKKNTPFLLLTGPTGCGKATTVLTVSKSMNILVTEWINPLELDYEIFKGPGQVAKFLEFFSDSKYNSLFSSANSKKILLIKEFPNAFVRTPEEFFNCLEACYYKNTHPVVFICSDANSSEVNLQRSLFPEEIQLKYSMANISFNPCTSTLLKKALKRAQDVLEENIDLFKIPSATTIEAIIASSMGDIRSAMNQFYMASLLGTGDIQTDISTYRKQGFKRKRTESSLTIKTMIRDEKLGFFHGLGRVLNPKRRVEGSSWRINCDLYKLVDEFSTQPSRFISFLYENYLKYFGDLEEAEKSVEVLSLSMLFMENWENHEILVVALSIVVLGLMIFNEHKVSKWTQIRAPQKSEKVCFKQDKTFLDPTDYFYYNLITKNEKYHTYR